MSGGARFPGRVAEACRVTTPNRVAAILTVALAPLHCAHPMRRIQAATYQAASGAGAAAIEGLRQGAAIALAGEYFRPQVLPHPYAFNLFNHNAAVNPETSYNSEEEKVVAETRRIFDAPALPVGITCIRVPVLRAHAIAATVKFDARLPVEEARALLAGAPGLRLVDDRAANLFRMSSEATGREEVLVSRPGSIFPILRAGRWRYSWRATSSSKARR